MNYLNSIFGKTIFALLLGFLALAAFYQVNTSTINNIYQSVDDLSKPIQKLRIVNQINAEINNSNKYFKESILRSNEKSLNQFQQKTKILLKLTDSLKEISKENIEQLLLIDSIAKLLRGRNNKLIEFYRFNKSLGTKNPYNEEIESLTELLAIDSTKPEMIISTETESIKSTRIDTVKVEQKKKNILTKLFPPKKKIETVITEEAATSVVSDTVYRPKENTGYLKAQELLKNISKTQETNRIILQKKETEINRSETAFNEKVTSLIATIENDLNEQTNTTQSTASESLARSIRQINMIFSGLLVATLILLSLMIIDITKSRKYKLLLESARDEAENQSRAKEVFLSNMSHELRTPLQSILGYSEQLIKNQTKESDNDYIDAIQQSSEHLLNVVNEVLEYSSINSGKFIFDHIDFDLKQVVEEVINMVGLRAKQKNLSLEINGLPENAVRVNGDAFRLKQILLNLLGNAIKYTEKGTVTLLVTIRELNGKTIPEFTISDTGPGIPYALQQKIFDQFEQVSTNLELRRSGTGLGLAITKALISSQGGKIHLKSMPGKGANFTFQIPYNPAKNEKTDTQWESPAGRPFTGEVWLVDDDKMILQLCSIILTKHHIKHTCFSSADEMLLVNLNIKPAAAILDIRMPGKSGLELCRELRMKYGNTVQIIALTAHVLPDEKTEMMESGFNEILTKPFKENQLISLLNNLKTGVHDTHENIKDDFKNVEAFATSFEESDRQIIFGQYLQDTKEDIRLIQQSNAENKLKEVADIAHRLAGRTAQIGGKNIGGNFRTIEIQLRENPDDFLATSLMEAVSATNELLAKIENLTDSHT